MRCAAPMVEPVKVNARKERREQAKVKGTGRRIPWAALPGGTQPHAV